ncbi:binding-protein-dependent transport system inner membrane component domain-containing protein [Ditylenchus destructor]|nr:binding-protein-dependent transport system inner membrane component domain-containing protein [Ditylenchus destructor]
MSLAEMLDVYWLYAWWASIRRGRWAVFALTVLLALGGHAARAAAGGGPGDRAHQPARLAALAGDRLGLRRPRHAAADGGVLGLLLPARRDRTEDQPVRDHARGGGDLRRPPTPSEIVRAGLRSLPGGQLQAAQALGMTRGQALRLVLLPQALRRMLPSLVNQLASTIKQTSLVPSSA